MHKLRQFLDQNPTISYDEENKKEFKRLGKSFLKDVVSLLRRDIEEERISFNPGGIAVSGDHSLYIMFKNGKGACVFFSSDGMCDFVTMRSIKHMEDYSGGMNQNFSMKCLGNVEFVAKELKRIGGLNET